MPNYPCCCASPPPPPVTVPPPPGCGAHPDLPTTIHFAVADGTALGGGPCLSHEFSCQWPIANPPGPCSDTYLNQSADYVYGPPPAGLNAYETAHSIPLTTFTAWWSTVGYESPAGGVTHGAAMNWPYMKWNAILVCRLERHMVTYGAYGPGSDPQWTWSWGHVGDTFSPLLATSDVGGTCQAVITG